MTRAQPRGRDGRWRSRRAQENCDSLLGMGDNRIERVRKACEDPTSLLSSPQGRRLLRVLLTGTGEHK